MFLLDVSVCCSELRSGYYFVSLLMRSVSSEELMEVKIGQDILCSLLFFRSSEFGSLTERIRYCTIGYELR